MYALPGETRTATLGNAPSGLVGTLTVKVIDPLTGTVHQAPTAVGVVEYAAGEYAFPITAPTAAGDYSIVWDAGAEELSEDLFVRGSLTAATPVAPGTPYFTAAEFRDRYDDQDLGATVTDDEIAEARDVAEQILEDACGVAFVPRTTTETLYPNVATTALRVSRRELRDVTSAIDEDGDAIDLTDHRLNGAWVHLDQGWATTISSPVTVTYVHGMDAPPARVKRAAMILARNHLVEDLVTDRRMSEFTDVGVVRLATPGVAGSITGIPEVDATIHLYRRKSYIG